MQLQHEQVGFGHKVEEVLFGSDRTCCNNKPDCNELGINVATAFGTAIIN
jgi:hypothetical protein